ncbi:TetR/AcrR family transcriptional regulator [Actinocorallia populi]|uniref:TetR/AcrR family transcriptional regulator n=1 Tax=Actinocorallia populi TaxID=2079200 RepID=UPI000D096819|nr:TetR/AcrR family transcriptional regulator [Actinocorallia populi]
MSVPDHAPERPDGRQARWDRHNHERQQHIVGAAIAVIEENEPGTHVHLQQIAERAGLTRSVIYRHFADRAGLDRAVLTAVVDSLADELLPAVTLDGTIPDIIERVVSRYVSWAVAHPSLHRLAEAEPAAPAAGPLQRGLERIAEQVMSVVVTALDALGAPLRDEERAMIDPLSFGLVGAVFSAVRRWLVLGEGRPPAPVLVTSLSDSVWYLLEGHARSLGVDLRRDQPVQAMLEQAALVAERG